VPTAAVHAARLVLWDFDGVIKDSVDVKTQAFVRLFEAAGPAVGERVRRHHLANGGMSRFEKLPVYLEFAGEDPTPARVQELCEQFARLVRQAVIDSPWVPGAEERLRGNPDRQIFGVVSATPQEELEQILGALDLRACLADVFGAPTSKVDGIKLALGRHGVKPEEALMIGDARADWSAATAAGVPFLLRRHRDNAAEMTDYSGPWVRDLTDV